MLTLCLYSFLCIMHSTTSYEILGLFPFPAKSHFLAFDSLMQELSSRGHNVTIYNTFPKTLSIPNYHEVDISHCFKLPDRLDIEKLKSKSTWFLSFQDVYAFTYYLPSYTEISKCEPLIKLANVTGTTKKYDLVITEIFHNEFSLLFASKMNIPVIGIVAGDTFPWHWYTSGLPENPSYIPMIFGEPMWKTGFFRRVEDALVYLYSFYQYHSWRQMMENTAFKIFRSSVPFQDLAKNVSLLFLNRHFAYQTSRPIVPNVVEIGGLNIKSVAELPENIEKFINESQHGVVYFCMGSLLRGETFPEEKRNAFLYAFSKIPQRVLWKWEGEVLPGKSDNIMISKWMPQRDILAHPNVKLFISHGGLLGTSEAVYEGVPVLGIPIFGDQRTNIKSLEANGAGELLDYNEITKDVVLEKIQRLLNDPKYKENAKQLSARYRDRPMSPLDTAVYWTEYVIRHKGAPHLRTAAADMPWYQYLLLDVIAFLILVTVSALAILYYSIKLTLRFLCNLICGKKSSSKPATGKKVKRN